ncbi:hypothetical protein, partial [Providencia sp. Je.9.19]
AAAKLLETQNQQLTKQLAEKVQQGDKTQTALIEQTAIAAQKAALETELASAKQQLQAQQTTLSQNEQNYAAAQKQLALANADLER